MIKVMRLRSALTPRSGFREACGCDTLERNVFVCKHVLVPRTLVRVGVLHVRHVIRELFEDPLYTV